MKKIIKSSIDNINRVTRLEQMNEVMESMNNEDAYDSWFRSLVFETDRVDFDYIANDDELYDEMCELYEELYREFRWDGLYKPSPAAVNFAMKSDKAFGYTDKLKVYK